MKLRTEPNSLLRCLGRGAKPRALNRFWRRVPHAPYHGRVTYSTTSDRVRLDVDGDIAWIVLDAPEQHNALEADDLVVFRSHLGRVDADEVVRVLVITGSGDATFCAGASLAQLESGDMSGDLFETLTDGLAAVRVPTVCALNGSVYGGGAEIALCCDFRIGVTGSRLAIPAARLGVCYPVGGLTRYVHRLGLTVAQRLLVASEEVDAHEMLRVGFLTELVAPTELKGAADRLAGRLASHAPLVVQAMKRILSQVASGSLDVEEARALVARCASSSDLQEGLAAKREGRAPRFEAR